MRTWPVPDDELVVLHVQAPVPPRVKTMLGAGIVNDYHSDEAQKVLEPIERFLKRHNVPFKTSWVVGSPSQEVLRVAQREKVHMIVMGTHGHGLIGRALHGQRGAARRGRERHPGAARQVVPRAPAPTDPVPWTADAEAAGR